MKPRATWSLIIVLVFALFLVQGCGSSDDNGTTTPTTDTPGVTLVQPAQMHIGDTVTIKGTGFGDNQGSGTVKVNSVDVKSTGKSEIKKVSSVRSIDSWSDTEIKVVLPPGITPGNVTIEITNNDGKTGYYGAGTTSPGELVFVEPEWHDMELLSSSYGIAEGVYRNDDRNPLRVVRLPNNRMIAVFPAYHDNDQNESRLYARVWNGSGWDAQTEISADIANQNPFTPNIDVDSDGNALLVWSQNDGTNQRIYYSYFNGSTWTDAATIDGDNYGEATPHENGGPHVAFANDGTAVAIWRGATGNMYASIFVNGSFGSPATIDNDTGEANARVPRIAFIPGTNTAFAVWCEYVTADTEYGLFARKYTSGGGWDATALRLDFSGASANDDVKTKGVAFNAERGLVAFQKRNNSDGNELFYNAQYNVTTDTWVKPGGPENRMNPAPYDFSLNTFRDMPLINVKFLSTGEGVIAFPDRDAGDDYIASMMWKTDGSWTEMRDIQGVWSDDIKGVGNLAVDAFGNAMYLYKADVDDPYSDSEVNHTFVTRFSNMLATWDRPETAREALSLPLTGDNDYSSDSNGWVEFDSRGRAYGVFMNQNGDGDYMIWYSLFY